jgi:hypothetical protein
VSDKLPPTKRKPKRLPDEELAAILAHASLHDAKSASERFHVSLRSIQRWKAELRAGKLPGVASLVAEQKQKALERSTDLLTETFDMSLRALQTKLPEMTGRQIVGACKILGELRQGRDFLTEPDVDGSRANQPAPSAQEHKGPPPKRARGEASGADEGRDPVH